MKLPYAQGRFRITPVSPIAICSGNRIPPMEIHRQGSMVRILDLRRFLADPAVPARQKLDVASSGFASGVPAERYTRYQLPMLWNAAPPAVEVRGPVTHTSFQGFATARGAAQGSPIPEILEAIKDSQGRPYLPGSSLKGAIRTALAVALWNSVDEEARNRAIGEGLGRGKSQFAARFLEEALFGGGRNAVMDSLKLLVVRDSSPLPPDHLALAELWVMTPSLQGQLEPKRRPTDFKNYLEVLLPTQDFSWEQPFLLRSYEAKPHPDFQLREAALEILASPDRLLESIRSFGQNLLDQELAFYKKHGPKPVSEFTQSLAARAATEAFLPIGFGTGWRTKTVFLSLRPEGIEAIRDQFQLDKGRSGPRFPKTRKIVFRNGQPWRPLGWVKIELAPNSPKESNP